MNRQGQVELQAKAQTPNVAPTGLLQRKYPRVRPGRRRPSEQSWVLHGPGKADRTDTL